MCSVIHFAPVLDTLYAHPCYYAIMQEEEIINLVENVHTKLPIIPLCYVLNDCHKKKITGRLKSLIDRQKMLFSEPETFCLLFISSCREILKQNNLHLFKSKVFSEVPLYHHVALETNKLLSCPGVAIQCQCCVTKIL